MGTEGPAAGDKQAVSMKCGGSSLGSITVLALGLAGVLAACGGGGVAKGRTVVPDLFCLTPIQARAALRQDGLVGIAHLTVGAPPPIGRDMSTASRHLGVGMSPPVPPLPITQLPALDGRPRPSVARPTRQHRFRLLQGRGVAALFSWHYFNAMEFTECCRQSQTQRC